MAITCFHGHRVRPVCARRYVVKFAFDGRDFDGYARQRDGHTVEDEVIAGLRGASIAEDIKRAHFLSAARVDKGVSAVAAAAAFTTEAAKARIVPSLNANVSGITFHSIVEVPLNFNPRHRAESRWYRYHYKAVGLEQGLDVPLMRDAASLFMGEHDFSAFARVEGRSPVRQIQDIRLERKHGFLVLDIWGRSFLWNQTRRMATALWMVGARTAAKQDVQDALEGRGRIAFGPAPAEGLFLLDVIYPGLRFDHPSRFQPSVLGRLRDDFYRERCEAMYFEYLRELVPF